MAAFGASTWAADRTGSNRRFTRLTTKFCSIWTKYIRNGRNSKSILFFCIRISKLILTITFWKKGKKRAVGSVLENRTAVGFRYEIRRIDVS